jgi:hypothetical protein
MTPSRRYRSDLPGRIRYQIEVRPRALRVRGPMIPSGLSPLARWNWMTACRVFGPKLPSSTSGGQASAGNGHISECGGHGPGCPVHRFVSCRLARKVLGE